MKAYSQPPDGNNGNHNGHGNGHGHGHDIAGVQGFALILIALIIYGFIKSRCKRK